VGIAPAALGACYSYAPVAVHPAPQTHLALVLSDRGRVGAGASLGPAVLRVEGTLVDVTDTAYVLSVSDVQNIGGVRNRWGGEVVTVPREYVASTYERRFSGGKTAALAVGVAGAFVAFAASRSLFGFGGGDDGGTTPPPVEQ
jgi:hypothetical protein